MPNFKKNTKGYKMKANKQSILKDFKFDKNPYATSKPAASNKPQY